MENFELIEKLGEGAFSEVHKVRRKSDGKIYALKKVLLGNLTEKEKINALNEVRILASLNTFYIISYKESFFDENETCLGIVMEYANQGDLFQKITDFKENNKSFEEDQIWKMFLHIVKGLKVLHDLKIIHRDLKSANVFLFKNGIAKLGDLNVSKLTKKDMATTQTGTPYYSSPEVWKDQPYDNKSDIWSLGCILYEMICLKPPFRSKEMEGLFNKITKGVYAKIPDKYSNDLSEACKLLLNVDPTLRPSCEQILKNPIIKKRLNLLNENPDDLLQEKLLKTIRCPKNLFILTKMLPPQNYKILIGEDNDNKEEDNDNKVDEEDKDNNKSNIISDKINPNNSNNYFNNSNTKMISNQNILKNISFNSSLQKFSKLSHKNDTNSKFNDKVLITSKSKQKISDKKITININQTAEKSNSNKNINEQIEITNHKNIKEELKVQLITNNIQEERTNKTKHNEVIEKHSSKVITLVQHTKSNKNINNNNNNVNNDSNEKHITNIIARVESINSYDKTNDKTNNSRERQIKDRDQIELYERYEHICDSSNKINNSKNKKQLKVDKASNLLNNSNIEIQKKNSLKKDNFDNYKERSENSNSDNEIKERHLEKVIAMLNEEKRRLREARIKSYKHQLIVDSRSYSPNLRINNNKKEESSINNLRHNDYSKEYTPSPLTKNNQEQEQNHNSKNKKKDPSVILLPDILSHQKRSINLSNDNYSLQENSLKNNKYNNKNYNNKYNNNYSSLDKSSQNIYVINNQNNQNETDTKMKAIYNVYAPFLKLNTKLIKKYITENKGASSVDIIQKYVKEKSTARKNLSKDYSLDAKKMLNMNLNSNISIKSKLRSQKYDLKNIIL